MSVYSGWDTRFQDQNITINADQVELTALFEGTSSLQAGTEDERIADALDDFDDGEDKNLELWAREDLKLDNADGATLEELQRRKDALGVSYPFLISNGSLTYNPSADAPPLYEALLCISQAKSLTKGKYTYLPRQFEFLACIVCEEFLGIDSRSLRTGWPRGQGEPKRLKDLVTKLRELSGEMPGEWKWRPKEGLPEDPDIKNAKECGVDVVAWKKSVDQRAGQLYILGQCACGKDWVHDKKLAELKIKNIVGVWVEDFPVPPIKAFFTPFHAKNALVLDASRTAQSLIFDRTRILLYSLRNVKLKEPLVKDIIQKIIKIVENDYL